MSVQESPKATWPHDPVAIEQTIVYLKRSWCELSGLSMVRVWTDRFRVYDVNGDCFEVTGIGYPDEQIVKLLDMVLAVYRPESLHTPTGEPFKEYKTGRRYTWGDDRVM